jgi:uncharacterized membrane protein
MKTQYVRPKMGIPKNNLDKAMELVSLICVIAIIISACWFYNIAPAKVPMHFDYNGNVDRYGSKAELFILPIIAVALFFGLHFISNKPYLFNYLHELNENNVLKSYKTASSTLYFVKMMVLLLFVFIEIVTYKAMFTQHFKLNSWFLFVPISMVVIVPIVVALKAYKASNT